MIFKIIVLALMLIFYVCYFVKMIAQKRKGITTDQLGKGKTGFVKFIEITLKCTTYVLPALQLVSIFTYSGNIHLSLRIAGAAIELIGVAAFIASVLQMKDNWRAGVQKDSNTSLVTTGIYAISRNPAFLGFELMYIGIMITFFNWYLWVGTGITIVLFHLQIVNVEEDFLIAEFGDEYLKYKNKVCRYLGRKFWR